MEETSGRRRAQTEYKNALPMPTVKTKLLKNSFSRSLFFSLFSPVLTAVFKPPDK